MREFLYFIKIIFWILGNDIVDLSRATGRAVKNGTIKFGKFMAPRCKNAAKKTKAFLILCKNYTIKVGKKLAVLTKAGCKKLKAVTCFAARKTAAFTKKATKTSYNWTKENVPRFFSGIKHAIAAGVSAAVLFITTKKEKPVKKPELHKDEEITPEENAPEEIISETSEVTKETISEEEIPETSEIAGEPVSEEEVASEETNIPVEATEVSDEQEKPETETDSALSEISADVKKPFSFTFPKVKIFTTNPFKAHKEEKPDEITDDVPLKDDEETLSEKFEALRAEAKSLEEAEPTEVSEEPSAEEVQKEDSDEKALEKTSEEIKEPIDEESEESIAEPTDEENSERPSEEPIEKPEISDSSEEVKPSESTDADTSESSSKEDIEPVSKDEAESVNEETPKTEEPSSVEKDVIEEGAEEPTSEEVVEPSPEVEEDVESMPVETPAETLSTEVSEPSEPETVATEETISETPVEPVQEESVTELTEITEPVTPEPTVSEENISETLKDTVQEDTATEPTEIAETVEPESTVSEILDEMPIEPVLESIVTESTEEFLLETIQEEPAPTEEPIVFPEPEDFDYGRKPEVEPSPDKEVEAIIPEGFELPEPEDFKYGEPSEPAEETPVFETVEEEPSEEEPVEAPTDELKEKVSKPTEQETKVKKPKEKKVRPPKKKYPRTKARLILIIPSWIICAAAAIIPFTIADSITSEIDLNRGYLPIHGTRTTAMLLIMVGMLFAVLLLGETLACIFRALKRHTIGRKTMFSNTGICFVLTYLVAMCFFVREELDGILSESFITPIAPILSKALPIIALIIFIYASVKFMVTVNKYFDEE